MSKKPSIPQDTVIVFDTEIECPSCGVLNDPTNKNCEVCNTKIPEV